MNRDHRPIVISPRRVAWLTAVAAGLLIVAHAATQAFMFATGYRSVYGVVPLFDLDSEANIPAFFSALLLVLSSAATGLIAALKHRDAAPYAWHWKGLALGFLYAAADEMASIHELAIRPMRELLGTYATGIFHFAWTLPAIGLLVVLAALYVRFWAHLPARVRQLFFWAGALYVSGAVGVELAGSHQADLYGQGTATYSALVMLEEALEMGGGVLSLFAGLSYLERHAAPVHLRFRRRPPTTHPERRKVASGGEP